VDLKPEDIYEKVTASVVVVLAYDFNNNLKSQGSGVVIDRKGYIATNYHVYAECERLEIKHNDKIINEIEVIGADVEKDILIIKVKENIFPAISKANFQKLKVGQRIYAIGSPLGYENSISDGIIGGLRNISELNRNYIQITTSISPGSSGGAVVNARGELIGISTLTHKGGQNINFAIPITDIDNVKLAEPNDKLYLETLSNFYKGYNSFLSKDYDNALKYFEKCLSLKPFPNVYNNLGCTYDAINNFDKAISNFNLAINLDLNYVDAFYNLAHTYQKMKKYNDAVKYYKKAVEIEPTYASAIYNIGYLYELLKEYNLAETYYNKTLEVNKNHVKAIGGLAGITAQRGELNESVKLYEQAIRIDSFIPELYFNLATVYYFLKDFNSAIKTLKTAIELNPNYIEAYLKISGIYIQNGDYSSAVNYTRTAARLGSKDAQKILIQLNETW
jgi:tetratricopeptide (TPR) repeat protein